MIFKFIKSNKKEEIIAYGNEKNKLICEIEKLCSQDEVSLVGYDNGIIKELNPINIECFFTSDERIFALVDNKKYQIKKRLYELSNTYKDNFVYINQSCLANIRKIDHFDASISGCLMVIFKSGYKDYVSRRQIKNIKERLGIK